MPFGIKFQSTFPRGERPQQVADLQNIIMVSIHVPARGTTASYLLNEHEIKVSIHVPARGTTEKGLPALLPVVCFNPRSREGNDAEELDEYRKSLQVSIHVPARGTTQRSTSALWNVRVSIHVPARGTTGDYGLWIAQYAFQSTFPRGERRRADGVKPENFPGFNPRSREGNDERQKKERKQRECFNPRSREGNDLHRWHSP